MAFVTDLDIMWEFSQMNSAGDGLLMSVVSRGALSESSGENRCDPNIFTRSFLCQLQNLCFQDWIRKWPELERPLNACRRRNSIGGHTKNPSRWAHWRPTL